MVDTTADKHLSESVLVWFHCAVYNNAHALITLAYRLIASQEQYIN